LPPPLSRSDVDAIVDLGAGHEPAPRTLSDFKDCHLCQRRVYGSMHDGAVDIVGIGVLGKRDRGVSASRVASEDLGWSATRAAGADAEPAAATLDDNAGEVFGAYEVRISH